MKKQLLSVFAALTLCFSISAQTTVTVTATGVTGSFNTGSVNSGGTKNDGDMVDINTSQNAGWAKFDMTSLPAGAIVMSASAAFTTFSTTLSGASNNLYGFVGDPSVIAGATLYTNCTSGTTFNNSTWSANALNTKALNGAGVSFIQTNITSNQLCIGYARASTNNYNIYGYSAAAGQQPMLVVTYSVPPACAGAPNAGTVVASNTVLCAPQNVNLSLTGSTSATGLSYQWFSSPDGTTWSPIPTATNVATTQSVTATTYYQCAVACGTNVAASTTLTVNYGVVPGGVTAISSSSLACVGQSVTVNLGGPYAIPGIMYQWQSSPNGSTWTSIPTATTSVLTQTISSAVYYQAILTCATNTINSSAAQVTLTGANVYATVPFLEAFDNTWQSRCDNQNVPTTANWASNPTTGNNSWRRQDAGATAAWSAATTATVAPMGTGCADFHSYYAADKSTGNLDLYIDMSGASLNYEMSFYNFNTSGADSLEVWLSTNGGSTFTKKAGYNIATVWTKQVITLGSVGSASCIVRFRGISDYGANDIGLDSLKIYTAVCTTPPVAGTISGPNNVNTGTVNSYTVSPSTGSVQWFSATSATGPYSPIGGATSASNQTIMATGSGTVYYAVIASSPGCMNDTTNSSYQVTINFPGDNVCSAIPLTIGTSTASFMPYGATVQTGEVAPPAPGTCSSNMGWCNNTLDNSMWFTFVAPASGFVTVQSPGFDTQLAVWKAATCSGLLSASTATLVGANDDDTAYIAHAGAHYSSYVRAACLTPGMTYYIQLDSYNAAASTESTTIIITDMGSPLNASFTGLAANYCITSSGSALTPATMGGVFTVNTNTASVNSFSPTTVGTNTVMYSIFGCMTNSTTVVGNPPAAAAMTSNTLVCSNFGQSAILTASSTATSYTWSNGANTMTTSVTPTVGTTYTLTVNDGICNATATVFVDAQICAGINNAIASTAGITVFPNPTNGILNITIAKELTGTTSIEVYDALGKLAVKENLSAETTTINTSKLENGIYMFKVINNNQAIKTGKIVKQ